MLLHLQHFSSQSSIYGDVRFPEKSELLEIRAANISGSLTREAVQKQHFCLDKPDKITINLLC